MHVRTPGRRRARALGVGAAAAALLIGVAGPAAAATLGPPLATGLVGPLGLSVTPGGTVYVAQSFANTITRISPSGARTDLPVDAQGAAGLSAQPDGSLVYTYSIHDDPASTDPFAPTSQLRRVGPDGKVSILGYIGRYEVAHNPDHVNTYGFAGLSPACAKQVPPQIGGAPYRGLRDSHPYAVASLGGGSYAVADAGVNAVLKVAPDQTVSTIAVLPPVPVTVTAGAATALGLPSCTVGKTYRFEPVPTDVAVGPDGMLYVSSLAGGPEDGSLGALGGVFRVDPATGSVTRIGSGFAGATGVAVGAQGRVYVAELYAGRVSYLKAGRPAPLVTVPGVTAVDYARGKLYVTGDALPPQSGPPDGKVLTVGF